MFAPHQACLSKEGKSRPFFAFLSGALIYYSVHPYIFSLYLLISLYALGLAPLSSKNLFLSEVDCVLFSMVSLGHHLSGLIVKKSSI